jgi:hypothetical protein
MLLLVVEEQVRLSYSILSLGNPAGELEIVELGKFNGLLGRVEPQHGVEV